MKPLWSPKRMAVESTAMWSFMKRAEKETGLRFPAYGDFHAWSVGKYKEFWKLFLKFSAIEVEGDYEPVCDSETMPGVRFFPNLRLNFAQNLLRFQDEQTALVSVSESRDTVKVTYGELSDRVSELAAAMRKMGIRSGDRVAGYLPNIWETVAAMLAATSLGATWSSCSPDFGVRGVLDRFGQIGPRLLFSVNAYMYNGKVFDCLEKLDAIQAAIPEIEKVVVIPLVKGHGDGFAEGKVTTWESFASEPAQAMTFEMVPFNHPLYIMYSSGTTGAPKCIVHGAGGTLLQHAKELILHSDLRRDDNITYFTTCGWMMWNWLVSSLFVGSTVTLFDGSPSYPDMSTLWRLVEKERITHFGTSARYINSCRGKVTPKSSFDLDRLRVILSTGSPLLVEDFEWIYEEVKKNVCLSSISGGTDIISCFMLGNPVLPVYRGEIQCLGLGMDVAAFDEGGRPVTGQKGELVCRKPAPSMPICFFNDPDNAKYRKAYFEKYPGIWWHGDFIELTPHGGVIVYGRSDATLNPGGVRIGTAEIYRIVEALPEVEDSLVIGQPWEGDVRVVLFVKLAKGITLSEALADKIRKAIRSEATPRHVPKIIWAVEKIPYTINGKKVEIAVLDIVSGLEPKNKEALSDPTALDCYRNLKVLAS